MSRPFWLGVAVRKLPDEFVDGIVLAEGFEQEEEPAADQLNYAILVRTVADTEAQAHLLVAEAVKAWESLGSTLITDKVKSVIRQERRVVAPLQPGDTVVKNSFVGYKADSAEAKATALEIVHEAIQKRWWQFWR